MKNFEKLSKMELNMDQLEKVSGGDIATAVNTAKDVLPYIDTSGDEDIAIAVNTIEALTPYLIDGAKDVGKAVWGFINDYILEGV